MIRLARETEPTEPLGITEQVCDAATLPLLGSFDLVTPVFLLTYATSKDQMLCIFRNVYDNLWRVDASSPNPGTQRSPSARRIVRRMALPCRARGPWRIGMPVRPSFSPSLRSASAATSGTRPHMSGRCGKPGSGSAPGTPPRWHRKTWHKMGKPIGAISTTMVRLLGWSVQSEVLRGRRLLRLAGTWHIQATSTGWTSATPYGSVLSWEDTAYPSH
jgi:hypothetical protein